ncbi:hypothetical protein BJX70DRAFT_39661 [Aspergillus crustosus]
MLPHEHLQYTRHRVTGVYRCLKYIIMLLLYAGISCRYLPEQVSSLLSWQQSSSSKEMKHSGYAYHSGIWIGTACLTGFNLLIALVH